MRVIRTVYQSNDDTDFHSQTPMNQRTHQHNPTDHEYHDQSERRTHSIPWAD